MGKMLHVDARLVITSDLDDAGERTYTATITGSESGMRYTASFDRMVGALMLVFCKAFRAFPYSAKPLSPPSPGA